MPDRGHAIRDISADDLPAMTTLSRAVAWPHRAEDLSFLLGAGSGRAAVDGATGAVVGVALWWPCGPAAATLGMVIVDPRQQGRGIGRRLVESVLADIGPRAVMLIATTAGLPLYAKLGFQVTGRIVQHQGVLSAPAAAPIDVRPARADDTRGIRALDAAALGAGRESVLQRLLDGDGAVVLDRGQGPEGYAVRRRFGRGDLVGPIVAPDEAAAVALFQAAARPGFVRVDITADAGRLADSLVAAGLAAVDSPHVMVRGNWPVVPGQARRFALIAQALG